MPSNEASVRVLCAALIATSGCAEFWGPAGQDRAVEPRIIGIATNYPRPNDRRLVVAYRAVGSSTDVCLLIPLDGSGQPLPPFRPEGLAHCFHYGSDDVPPSAARVPATQAALIQSAVVAVDRPHCLPSSPPDWITPLNLDPHDRSYQRADDLSPIRVLAYRTDEAGRLVIQQIDTRGWSHNLLYGVGMTPAADEEMRERGRNPRAYVPAGTRLVLVPSSIPRPAGDQRRDQIVAALLLPVGVVGGAALLVVLSPLLVIAIPMDLAMDRDFSRHPGVRSAAELRPIQIGDTPLPADAFDLPPTPDHATRPIVGG